MQNNAKTEAFKGATRLASAMYLTWVASGSELLRSTVAIHSTRRDDQGDADFLYEAHVATIFPAVAPLLLPAHERFGGLLSRPQNGFVWRRREY